MIEKYLPILSRILIFIGFFPFLSLLAGVGIAYLAGCIGPLNGDCDLFGSAFGRGILSMMLAFTWIIYTLPVGAIGMILLVLSMRKAP